MPIQVEYLRTENQEFGSKQDVVSGDLEVGGNFDAGQVVLSLDEVLDSTDEIRLTVDAAESLAHLLLAQVKVLREGYEEEVPVYSRVPYDPSVHNGMLTGVDIGGVFHVEVRTGTVKRWVQPIMTFQDR
jgi:hypothetical protein